MNISECPFSEIVNRERGRDGRQEKEEPHQVDPETSFYYIRCMGEIAMYRDRSVRMIRELEEVGGAGVDENLAECLGDLEMVGNDWEIKSDEARVGTKSPLVNNDKRGGIQNYAPTK